MSKELNIVKILEGKPQGTKLYTPISGDVWLAKAEKDAFTEDYPIIVSESKDDVMGIRVFTAQGRYMNTGECLLFPSKNMRDWEKFAWERGDVLQDGYGIECMFDGWIEDDFTKFHSIYSITTDPSNEKTFYEDKVFCTKEYRKEGVKEQNDFIKNLEKKYGGKFNPETLEIEKPKPKFKGGDVVYVETKDGYKTISIFKEFSAQKKPLVYMNYFFCDKTLHLADKFDGYNILCNWDEIKINGMRLATEEEKELLFSKLEEMGKKWDSENLEIVDLPKGYKLKPFDKVLVRDDDDEAWQIGIYSHFKDKDPNYPYRVISLSAHSWRQCIPYEGNEELMGTSNKPKEGGEE